MLHSLPFARQTGCWLVVAILFLSLQSGQARAQATAQVLPGTAADAPSKPTAAPVEVSAFRQPAFLGGASELSKFLSRNLRFPSEAAEAQASGRVVLSFWVDEQGRAYGFGAVQSPHPALEAEAVRVVRMIERWEPGLQEGKPAAMQMYLPVVFKLVGQ